MISKIFVNLPVRDLDKSMAFFKAVGFSFNPQFTDKTGACMVMSEDIYAMLLRPTRPQHQDSLWPESGVRLLGRREIAGFRQRSCRPS